jgi:hypothetical protein
MWESVVGYTDLHLSSPVVPHRCTVSVKQPHPPSATPSVVQFPSALRGMRPDFHEERDTLPPVDIVHRSVRLLVADLELDVPGPLAL